MASLLAAAAPSADAAPIRRRFEPTDLELEVPGTVEIDVQVGATSGERVGAGRNRGGRLFAPDYEIDIGLTSRVEVGIDGALAVQPLRDGQAKLTLGEPLWSSVKLGLLDVHDVGPANAAALGLQLGPRLPLGGGYHGVGYELVTLSALDVAGVRFVFNAGGLVDPAAAGGRTRPHAVVGGVDVIVNLDVRKRWSFIGELGGGYYFGGAPHQLAATGGVAYDTGSMQWSLVTLFTLVGPADRVGLLLGMAPRWKLF